MVLPAVAVSTSLGAINGYVLSKWKFRGSEFMFALLLFGVVFDSVIRLFLTVASNFYRLVGIEEAWYGVIGTGVSLLARTVSSVIS